MLGYQGGDPWSLWPLTLLLVNLAGPPCPDIGSNARLDVSVKLCLDEIGTYVSRLSKACDIMWVGLTQSIKGLERKRQRFPEEEGALPPDGLDCNSTLPSPRLPLACGFWTFQHPKFQELIC